MREQIQKLREVMKKYGMDAWVAPTADAHQSEYVGDHDQCRAYLSGFTGSAGTLVVLKDRAALWVDGRYFVQGRKQLEGSGIDLMEMGEKGVPTLLEYLKENLNIGETLGFYAKLFGAGEGEQWEKELHGIQMRTDVDIVDEVWLDRPARSAKKVWRIDAYCGEETKSKLERVRKEMKENCADVLLACSLSDIAWLTNLRGDDIECNPLFLSYLAIEEDRCTLFIQSCAMSEEIANYLKDQGIETAEYDDWNQFVKELKGRKILLDQKDCDYQTLCDARKDNEFIFVVSPLALMKIVKNDTEVANMRKSHVRDGVYMVKYIKWIKESVKRGEKINEVEASDYLDKLRLKDEIGGLGVELSFDTISGYASNAAIVHYKANRETAATLEPRGLYLFDSGAQYKDGTTDVTRTIALGETSDIEKQDYTLTTIGMLRLLNARFKEGARGYNLDTYARMKMWEYGRDFNHGTGHGVGFCNTVHEGPNSIRLTPNPDPRRDVVIRENMVVSDEPGIYIEGSHGIRVENLVVSVKDEQEGFLHFDSLTIVPLDPEPLNVDIMEERDKQLYNEYQAMVYKTLSPYLDDEEKKWLLNETRAI